MTVPERNIRSDPADLDYWSRHAMPVLASLLRSTESYSSADEEAQLRLLAEHVLPNLGPRPSLAHTRSYLTTGGSPFQPSLNLSAGKPIVRYCWELLGPKGGSDSDPFAVDAAREILSYLSKVFGFSTRWSDAFLPAFALTFEEVRDVQAKLPKWLASNSSGEADISTVKRLPFSFVAFDLKGPKISTKVYFNPKSKEIATERPVNEIVWNALRSLKPAMNEEAIDIVSQFLDDRGASSTIELVGIDCVDDASLSDARVKLYVHTKSNSFNTVRDYVTLGGRLQDETTMKGLDILREFWHLLLQQPEGITDDDYNKPLNYPSLQSLYISFEMRPGDTYPEVKTYLPTWNYVRSDEETVRNYEEVFRKCGQAWGHEGRYKKAFESAFGPANHNRKSPIHHDASFLYSEKNGVYQTLYFSLPLAAED